jgi:probable F420-dependent oxidoreductase
MKIDGALITGINDAAKKAQLLQEMGYDGAYTLEGNSDPFYPLLLAAEHAPGLDLSTSIAVAFPRNPMHLAYQAWDLQTFSKGHFLLGLGSQIRAHIEKRFGTEFSIPAARMRELILAMKAIFRCWHDGERLDFRGEFYTHTLMTPIFNPGPNAFGKPPILMGALGPKMTEVAGEVSDGILIHPFNSMPFVLEQTLPALDRGLAKNGRTRDDVEISLAAMILTGKTEEEYKAAETAIKNLLGFYGSTPAYKLPMEAVGLGHLQEELNLLSKQGKWLEMGQRVDDKFLDAFCVRGEPETIADQLIQRYNGIPTRLSVYAPYTSDPSIWPGILEKVKAGCESHQPGKNIPQQPTGEKS